MKLNKSKTSRFDWFFWWAHMDSNPGLLLFDSRVHRKEQEPESIGLWYSWFDCKDIKEKQLDENDQGVSKSGPGGIGVRDT